MLVLNITRTNLAYVILQLQSRSPILRHLSPIQRQLRLKQFGIKYKEKKNIKDYKDKQKKRRVDQ